MIKLHDLFIGDFPITQRFGPSTINYMPYGYPGHNGLDIGCPSDTFLLNPFPKGNNVTVLEVREETGGYGKYVKIWDHTQKVVIVYAHCREVLVNSGDQLFFQQAVAFSDNTGNSTAPHLHTGLLFVDDQGVRLNSNTPYKGYVNPLDRDVVQWEFFSPTVPGQKDVPKPIVNVEVDKTEYLKLEQTVRDLQSTVDQRDRKIEGLERHNKELQDTINENTGKLLKQEVRIKSLENSTSALPPELPQMYKEVSDKYYAADNELEIVKRERDDYKTRLEQQQAAITDIDIPLGKTGATVGMSRGRYILSVPALMVNNLINSVKHYLTLHEKK